MEANKAKLLTLLNESPQFVIPIYQRTYSWTEKECYQLWHDIIRTGNDETISMHFVGSIVYIEEGPSTITAQSPQLVIDGQQRLTTVTLLIAALAKALGDDEPVAGFSAKKLRDDYLLNSKGHYKLLLSQTDKTSLIAIVDEREQPQKPSIRVEQNFKLLERLITDYKGDLSVICNGLAKLVVVDIKLTRGQDNPQLIFESMNSTGLELSQSDLIRNFILMGLEPELQTRLYKEFWRPMEKAMEEPFGQEAYNKYKYFDTFMRHYLTVKTGDIPRFDRVYEAFKKHAQDIDATDSDVEPLVKEIRDYAGYFCAMALGTESDPDLKLAFDDLNELKVGVAYPFLLELYHDYKAEVLVKEEFVEAIRLIEAYVFRRAICAIPTNSLNKIFATFTKALKKERYLESIKAHFLNLRPNHRFPKDEEFERNIQSRDLYNFRSNSYWLHRFENFGRKEHAKGYTIEHIMPQNKNLSLPWRTALGPDWERIHEEWLHTLGNLTLTAYNSEYGDKPFAAKRDMKGGFKESPLKVNAGLGILDQWDEAAIKNRAGQLAKKALDVWPAPELADDVLDAYRPKTTAKNPHSIEDHPRLVSGPMSDLFTAFRKEVMALDPCVSEEFQQDYVAYKAKGKGKRNLNFIDVVPQLNLLLISLNMRFADISAPPDFCSEISVKQRNGEAEFRMSNHEQIPDAIELVRQSLESKLGNEEIA